MRLGTFIGYRVTWVSFLFAPARLRSLVFYFLHFLIDLSELQELCHNFFECLSTLLLAPFPLQFQAPPCFSVLHVSSFYSVQESYGSRFFSVKSCSSFQFLEVLRSIRSTRIFQVPAASPRARWRPVRLSRFPGASSVPWKSAGKLRVVFLVITILSVWQEEGRLSCSDGLYFLMSPVAVSRYYLLDIAEGREVRLTCHPKPFQRVFYFFVQLLIQIISLVLGRFYFLQM